MLSDQTGVDEAHARREREIAELRFGLEVLTRQVRSLRREVQQQHEYIDTVTSALWKRLWWWCGGYYFRKVGRWYSRHGRLYRAWSFVCRVTGLPE